MSCGQFFVIICQVYEGLITTDEKKNCVVHVIVLTLVGLTMSMGRNLRFLYNYNYANSMTETQYHAAIVMLVAIQLQDVLFYVRYFQLVWWNLLYHQHQNIIRNHPYLSTAAAPLNNINRMLS